MAQRQPGNEVMTLLQITRLTIPSGFFKLINVARASRPRIEYKAKMASPRRIKAIIYN
jgi:hypothetical protein